MRLQDILHAHRISQADLAAGVTKPNGQPYSVAVINRIINHGVYPKTSSPAVLQQQIEARLATMGIHQMIDWPPADNPTSNTPKVELPDMEVLTQQARQVFKLPQSPFSDDVQTRADVYLSDEQRYIRQTMMFAAKQAGFVAVIGESGAGKTTLKRDLLEGIKQSNEPIIVTQPQTIDKTRLSAAHLCDAIIDDIGQGTVKPRRSMEAKARQIQKLLTDSSRAGNKHCLIIDEAHDLTVPMLKYLKRFWELEDGMKRLLAIVLIGQPELKMKLNERNADLREVVRRCEQVELQPLNAHVGDYLAHKFKRIGRPFDQVFANDAIGGLTERLTQSNGSVTVSQLYPLVVNNAVTMALNAAARLGQDQITADIFAAI